MANLNLKGFTFFYTLCGPLKFIIAFLNATIFTYLCYMLVALSMDHLHYRLNFDLNKSRQKFHHSLKEHHKISNIPKFRCEML